MEEIQVIVIDNQEVVTLYVDTNTSGVTSVNGETGVVVLDTSDIAENTNLYYTDVRVSNNVDVAANTLKTGITAQQATDITTNNAKVGYTDALVDANSSVVANTAKVGVTNEQENTINTELESGMTGEDLVLNVLSLTEAEYDAGTPVATTFYIITDA